MKQEELLLPIAEASHVGQMRQTFSVYGESGRERPPETLRDTRFLLSLRRYTVRLPPVA
jgi:hypothetical protein